MKCVTKLSHRSSGGGAKAGAEEGEGEEWEGEEVTANGGGAGGGAGSAPSGGQKRKRDDIDALLEAQSQQLAQLQQSNADILEQLRGLKELLSAQTKTEVAPP